MVVLGIKEHWEVDLWRDRDEGTVAMGARE